MPPKAKPGPEPTPIDEELILNLAAVGCTLEEMGAAVDLTERQLSRRINQSKALAAAVKLGRAKGRATLRGWQWAAAKKGNVVAQIWLGKQLLGQRSFEKEEKPEPIRAGSVSYQWVPRKSTSTATSSTNPCPAKEPSTTPSPDSKASQDP